MVWCSGADERRRFVSSATELCDKVNEQAIETQTHGAQKQAVSSEVFYKRFDHHNILMPLLLYSFLERNLLELANIQHCWLVNGCRKRSRKSSITASFRSRRHTVVTSDEHVSVSLVHALVDVLFR